MAGALCRGRQQVAATYLGAMSICIFFATATARRSVRVCGHNISVPEGGGGGGGGEAQRCNVCETCDSSEQRASMTQG